MQKFLQLTILSTALLTAASVTHATQPEPIKRPPTAEDCDPTDFGPRNPEVDYSLCEEGNARRQQQH